MKAIGCPRHNHVAIVAYTRMQAEQGLDCTLSAFYNNLTCELSFFVNPVYKDSGTRGWHSPLVPVIRIVTLQGLIFADLGVSLTNKDWFGYKGIY